MAENKYLSPELTELGNRIIEEHKEEFQEIYDGKYKVAYLYRDAPKTKNGKTVYGDCQLVTNGYKWTCEYDFMITFYTPNIVHMDKEQLEILMWHELKHCGIDDDKPYIIPHDLEDFKEIVDKYGPYWAEPKIEQGTIFDDIGVIYEG